MKKLQLLIILNFLLCFVNTSYSDERLISVKDEFIRFKENYHSAKIIVKCKRIYGEKYLKYKIDKIFRGEKKQIEQILDKDGFIRFMQYKRTPDDKKRYRSEFSFMFYNNNNLKEEHPRPSFSYSGIIDNKLEMGGLSVDMDLLSNPDKMNKRLDKIFQILDEWIEKLAKIQKSKELKTQPNPSATNDR